MRRLAATFGLLAALVFVTTVSAQSKPDFSGKWTQIKPAPTEKDVPLTLVQDATSITMTTPSMQRPGETDRLSLKLDGSPGTYGQFRGDGTIQDMPATAEWAGNKLAISLKAYSNADRAYTIRQTLSMDGELLSIESALTRDATGTPITDTYTRIYRKN